MKNPHSQTNNKEHISKQYNNGIECLGGNPMKEDFKTTITVSMPLPLYFWLKESQKNVSAFVVKSVEEKREREEEAQAQETT